MTKLLCLLPLGWGFTRRLFKSFRVCDLVAALLSGLVVVLYYFSRRAWYLNDLIALCIMGVSVKIFKIKSMKYFYTSLSPRNAVILLLPCAILDTVSAIISLYLEEESYDILVLRHFNYPLVLEIPLFQLIYNKKCSWVSIINIVLPGLVIGYNLRFDSSKNTAIYTVTYVVDALVVILRRVGGRLHLVDCGAGRQSTLLAVVPVHVCADDCDDLRVGVQAW